MQRDGAAQLLASERTAASRYPAAVSRVSGDAVGAEEDAQLGEEAVAGVDEKVVAEAEHGGLLGALEVHEHRAVAGVLGEDVLEACRPCRRRAR